MKGVRLTLALIALVLVGFGVAFWLGTRHDAASDAERAREALKTQTELEEKVDALDDDAVSDALGPWLRN